MACDISKGRGYFCGGQVGGIKKIYLASYFDGEKINCDGITTDANGIVTDVCVNAPDCDGVQNFYEFDLDRQLSSFNQTIVTGSGGAVVYQQELELHMSHDSNESWLRMQNIVEGLYYGFVLDNNGVYYFVGLCNGLQVTGGTYAHGGDVAYTDYVGYVLTMSGAEPVPAFNFGTTFPMISYTSGQLDYQETQYNTPQT